MNLQRLFEMQRQLDAHIEKEHPRELGEDRLAKKILALQVELGELANELPEVFKFWSNKKNNYEKALKEYVDGLHFILSIGLELGITEIYNLSAKKDSDLIFMFMDVNELSIILMQYDIEGNETYKSIAYIDMFGKFLGLGEMLGFTWEQIEEAYMQKNAENHARQERGY